MLDTPAITVLAAALAAEPAPPDTTERDRHAIAATITGIAEDADLHQWSRVSAAFAPSVVLDYGTPETLTPTAIIARWQPLLETFDTTQHILRDMSIRIEGRHAKATSQFLATHTLSGAVWSLTGRYEHQLVASASGWHVTHMRMIPGTSSGDAQLLEQAQTLAARRPVIVDQRTRNRSTILAFFTHLEALDAASATLLFAEDGRQVMPFAPAGFPRELEGRLAIIRQYSGLPTAFASMRFPDLVITDGADPDLFFASWRGEIKLRNGGNYDNTYAGFFVVRDGRIAEFHEYFNPLVLARAFGTRLETTFSVPTQP